MAGAHLYRAMGNVGGDGNGNTIWTIHSLIHRRLLVGHLLWGILHLFSLPSYGKYLWLVYSLIFAGLGYHDDLQTRTVFMEVLTRILQQVCNYSFTLLWLHLMISKLSYIFFESMDRAIFYDLVTKSHLGKARF